MRAVIITGGEIADYDKIKPTITKDDLVICADHGYDHALKMGITPRLVVGDFDSVHNIPRDVQIVKYPCAKDVTDTQIAIEHGINLGCDDFLLLGAIGTRLDHTLANMLLLPVIAQSGYTAAITDETHTVKYTENSIVIHGNKGDIVSLIPISDCTGVTTSELEYPLYRADLRLGTTLGISNVMLKDEAKVIIDTGRLLVMKIKNDETVTNGKF